MYDFFKALVLPPDDLLIVFAAGLLLLWRGRRRAGFAVMCAATLLFYLLCTPAISALLLRAVESPPATDEALAHSSAQAIVVLSGGYARYAPEYENASVDAITLQRLRYGAHLARRLGLPVLVSGGQPDDAPVSLAAMMKAALVDFGVEVRWIEDRSVNTYENAAFSAPLLKADGVTAVILVTHAAHMPRAVKVFAAQGLTVTPAPMGFAPVPAFQFAPRASAFQDSYYALYEALGDVWYALRH